MSLFPGQLSLPVFSRGRLFPRLCELARLRLTLWSFLWIGGIFFCFVSAYAHRPTESSAEFRWEHGRLEARTTFPTAMATRLIDDPAVNIQSVSDFLAHRDQLATLSTQALAVEVGGHAIQPVETTVELTREGEMVAISIYPPTPMASLSVQARFLERMPLDCFCLLRVWESADRLLGKRLLVRSAPRATVDPSLDRSSAPLVSPAPVSNSSSKK